MARRRGRGPGLDRRAARGFLAFGLVSTLLTVYMAFRIVGTDLGSGLHLSATFDDVSGLRPGDRVKVAGTPVGRVTSVEVEDGRAVVGMKVRSSLRLADDSSAVIRWRDLIGERELYLEPGSGRVMLKDGGKLTRTRSAADLGALVNNLAPLVGGIDPNEINRILQSFAVALDGNQDRIDQMTANLAGLLRMLGSRTGTIRQMVADYRTVTGALAARDRQIAQTIDNLTDLTRAFAQDREALGEAGTRLGDVAANLDQVLGGTAPQLGRLVDGAGALTEVAHRRMKDIDKMIKSLPSALQALLTLMDAGHFLRGNALCMNVVYTDDCPFPMNLPPPPASPSGGDSGGAPAVGPEAARLSPDQQQVFRGMVQVLFLGSQNGAG
jgi:phospholipid/cholesterol/gamma-HCH transport system substrate-binding protein